MPATRRRPWWKILSAVAATLVAILLIIAGWFHVMLSGGVENVLRNWQPPPDSNEPGLVASRNAARQSIDTLLATLAAANPFLSERTDVVADACEKGQNNYKVSVGYAYRCKIGVTSTFGLEGDFRARMIDLAQGLERAGCVAPEQAPDRIETILDRYYDIYHASSQKMASQPRAGYLVSDMPQARNYLCGRAHLQVGYFEKAMLDSSASVHQSELRAVPGLADVLRIHGHAIRVSIEEEYFRN